MKLNKSWFSEMLNKTDKPLASFITSLHGKQMEKQWETLFWGAPKSLQMVTAAMKFKDTCFLEEKLWPTQTAY